LMSTPAVFLERNIFR